MAILRPSNQPLPKRGFRLYCTQQYYTNRDEYEAVGQTQPWSFREYVKGNLQDLKREFKLQEYGKKKVDRPHC